MNETARCNQTRQLRNPYEMEKGCRKTSNLQKSSTKRSPFAVLSGRDATAPECSRTGRACRSLGNGHMLAASTLQLLGNLHRLFREAKSGCWLQTAFTRSFSGGDFQPTTNPDHMKHCGWCLLGFNITAVACSAVHKHHLQPGHSLSDAGMASTTAIEEERRAWYSVARIPSGIHCAQVKQRTHLFSCTVRYALA